VRDIEVGIRRQSPPGGFEDYWESRRAAIAA